MGRGCRAKRVSYEEGVARVRESGVVEKACRQGEKEGVARSRCQQGTSNWCCHKRVSRGGEKKVSPEVGVARERERVVSQGTRRGCCERWCRQGTKRRCHHKVESPGEGGVTRRRRCRQQPGRECCSKVVSTGNEKRVLSRCSQNWVLPGPQRRAPSSKKWFQQGTVRGCWQMVA